MIESIPELADYSDRDRQQASSEMPALRQALEWLHRPAPSETNHLELKRGRHASWARCALALFHNRANAAAICRFWSEAADRHIATAAYRSGLRAIGTQIFALGKLGAMELNLSSDIDLLFVGRDRTETSIRAAREFVRILSAVDEWGFCHRVDLELRPGGRSSPLIATPTEFENHYGYHGETWERLALVRLRAVENGDQNHVDKTIQNEVLGFANSFSYRKHLDYSVFEELRLLLSRIRAEYPERIEQNLRFHLKLQAGGIRDIELLVHALQVIHGGRNSSLQTRSTSQAIEALIQAEILDRDEGEFLDQTYWRYRAIENRLQAQDDQQTYDLRDPVEATEVRALASRVIEISESCFPRIETTPAISEATLVEAGVSLDTAKHVIERLDKSQAISRKSERDEKERRQFLNSFVAIVKKRRGDRNLALLQLVDFTQAVRAKASLFSLLNREPQLLNQMAGLFGVSPWAGQTLSSRPELLDAFLLRQDGVDIHELDPEQTYEQLAERRLLGELIAVLHFLDDGDLNRYSSNLTVLADSIVRDLLATVVREFGRSENAADLSLYALGKWGGSEFGIRSDLDFVLASRSAPSQDGQRIARRFLNRLTEAHRGGSIYSVDLRLRPSGNAGPVLISGDSLQTYLQTQSESWERQSWLRARPVIGQLDFNPQTVVMGTPWRTEDDKVTTSIAERLFKPLVESANELDLKLTHGGIAPIEFAVQIAILQNGPWAGMSLDTSTTGMLHFLEERFASWRQLGPELRRCYNDLRTVEQILRIAGDRSGSKLHCSGSELERVAQIMGSRADTTVEGLKSTLVRANSLLNQLAQAKEKT